MNLSNNQISEREFQVLESISFGMTVKEIAEKLYLSPHTIISYRRSLLQKLDVKNGAEMIRVAIEKGILEIRITHRTNHAMAC